MKIRNGFVSNSSSSSFIIMKLGEKVILDESGSDESCATMNIDLVIQELLEAKEKGIKNLTIEFGGSYDG